MAGYVQIDEKELKKLREDNEKYEKQWKESLKDSEKKTEEKTLNSFNAFAVSLEQINGTVQTTIDDMGKALTTPFNADFQNQLDEYATSIQSSFGLSKARMDEFKNTIADVAPELTKMGMTETEFASTIKEAMDGLGTSASLGKEAIVELAAASKVSKQDVSVLASEFRKVGVSVYDVGDRMKEVTDYARSVGVSVKAVSEGVVTNLDKMNLYNFEGGIKGLAKMAATSERLGLSMQTVFNQADKIMNPEGAIEMSAALQRLGVTSSGLLDPLRAMDLAQNDPEQLQKEMVNLGKEFTRFNEKTGQMEILPGAKRRLKEVGEAAGMTAKEFGEMALKSADFDMKLKQIKMPSIVGDQETKELIASMAQMKDGVATVKVRDDETGKITEKKVEDLTPDDIKDLQKATQDSSKSIEEIAVDQLGVSKQIFNFLESGKVATKFASATAPTISKFYGVVSSSYKDIAKGFSKSVGSTEDMRKSLEGIYKPMEDVGTSVLRGDAEGVTNAASQILPAVESLIKDVSVRYETALSETTQSVLSRVDKAYLQPPTVNETKTVNVNWNITGDPNVTKNIDQATFNRMLDTSTSSPDGRIAINNNLTNKTAPSAAVGSKN
jgi:hypothetical protein